MSLTLQYIIIGIIFIIAVLFVLKKFIPTKNKPTSGCGKSCGCDHTKIKS